jgi:hypothetical protein
MQRTEAAVIVRPRMLITFPVGHTVVGEAGTGWGGTSAPNPSNILPVAFELWKRDVPPHATGPFSISVPRPRPIGWRVF